VEQVPHGDPRGAGRSARFAVCAGDGAHGRRRPGRADVLPAPRRRRAAQSPAGHAPDARRESRAAARPLPGGVIGEFDSRRRRPSVPRSPQTSLSRSAPFRSTNRHSPCCWGALP
jgi:hypothetical protein